MFRRRLGEATNSDLKVLGVSVDGPDSHLSFIRNLDLNFPLAADQQGELCTAMGTCPGFVPNQPYYNQVRAAFVVERDLTISAIFNAAGGPSLMDRIWETAGGK